jgi:hypothetical protein
MLVTDELIKSVLRTRLRERMPGWQRQSTGN